MSVTLEERTVAAELPHHRSGSRHKYSTMRAICLQAEGKQLNGLEGEVHDELARRRSTPSKGILLPLDAPMGRTKRALDTATGSGSMQQTRPPVLIDVLRAKLAMARLGAQVRDVTDGVPSGAVLVPVKTAAAAVSWVGETFTPAQTNLTAGGVTMSPKTITTYTDISRRMLSVAVPEYTDVVIEDLATSIAIAIDAAAINGAGSANVPLGLFQYGSAIPFITLNGDSGNGAAPAYADVCDMEAMVGATNGDAPMDARIGFLTSAAGRNAFRQCDMGTASGRKVWKCHPMLIDGELRSVETVLGYPAVSTTNVPSNITKGSGTNLTAACLGNFADMLIHLFTGVDVVVNPYKQSTDGLVRVTALQDVDIAIRRYGSFCVVAGIICPTVS